VQWVSIWLYRAYLSAPAWVRSAYRYLGSTPRRYLREFILQRASRIADKVPHRDDASRRGKHETLQPIDGQTPVSLVGYFQGQFGVGENMRSLARALRISKTPYEICDVRWPTPGAREEAAIDVPLARQPRHPIQIYCINADQMNLVPVVYGSGFSRGSYRIGYWYWELSRFPSAWQDALSLVDEVWVGSRFTQEAVSAVSLKPVVYMPPSVEVELARSYSRGEFDLPANAFLFLFCFDLNSYVERKNPQACIKAFLRAFSDRPELPVGLVLKLMHGAKHVDAYAAIRELARKDARIYVRDLVLSRADAYGLQSVCDCFISLHRAEGFGLGMAESMLLGKPVIATGYSGNTDFTRFDNACLVRYRLVDVVEGAYPLGAGQVWAEPDIQEAAAHMHLVYADPVFRERIAAAGRQYVSESFSSHIIAQRVVARLEHISQRVGPFGLAEGRG
jgi:glycosyltransferase involved in cell wall biosynthesis